MPFPRPFPLLVSLAVALVCGLNASPAHAQSTDFPKPFDTQDTKAQPLTSPEEALKKIRLPDGFKATLFAAEPDVQNPIAMAFDTRGRLWISESYTYAESSVNFESKLRDRIIILEDTDHDGRFDRRTVFWDQAQKLTSIELGFGGVWALCAPQMLFIPDRDGDDKPDGPPEVVLDGWDHGSVRHNIVNGLKWGPDGWLYGRHGIQATSFVGKPGSSESQRTRLNCSIWRYHPTRGTFEVVCTGTTNPWGFDYDDHGQMFFINTVIGHLFHIVPGAHYRRMYGADFNQHTYELIDTCADHYHFDTGEKWSDIRTKGVSDTTSKAGGGHAHSGLMVYLGDNWPAEYRNRLLTVNLHGHRLNQDRIERSGAGYVARHGEDAAFFDDPWFRGIELSYGPDGGVYVLDWSDIGECHENDGVHRSSGRIYKLTYGTPNKPAIADVAQLSDLELVKLQLHKNDWYVRTARRLLQERAAAKKDLSAAKAALVKLFDDQLDVTRKLRAMWCLHSIDELDRQTLTAWLQHPEEHVRVWAVRLLADGNASGSSRVLEATAQRDASGLVQTYLASALQLLPVSERWKVALPLATKEPFAHDPALPLLIWYGIEPAIPGESALAMHLAEATRMPLLRRHIARRVTEDLDKAPEAVSRLVDSLLNRSDSFARLDILEGMSQALRGLRKATPPTNWPEVSSMLMAGPDKRVAAAARELSVVFGDGRALDELRQIVTNNDADPKARRDALTVLVDNRAENLVPLLHNLSGDRLLAAEAIRGLAVYGHADSPKIIVKQYSRLIPDARLEAITTLVSRPDYAAALLRALGEGAIPRGDVSAFHARQIHSFANAELDKQLATVWGELRDTPAERRELMARYKKLLSPEHIATANLPAGRKLFDKTCATCHVMYGQGKKVGPDLTGSNRKNLDYLLENIFDPSALVAADFKVSILVLTDGRVITGVIVEQNDRTLTVQTQQERMTILRTDIDETKPTSVSLMPDAVTQSLTEQQVRDLIGYLMAPGQVE